MNLLLNNDNKYYLLDKSQSASDLAFHLVALTARTTEQFFEWHAGTDKKKNDWIELLLFKKWSQKISAVAILLTFSLP